MFISDRIQNLSIQGKLMAMLAAPMVGLLLFALLGFAEKISVRSNATRVGTLGELAVEISRFVHESQKERGSTAIFLGSGGELFGPELQAQRLETDREFLLLEEKLHSFAEEGGGEYGASIDHLVEASQAAKGQLKEVRSRISSLDIPPKEAIGYYTAMNARLLNLVGVMPSLDKSGEYSAQLGAFEKFLKAKERVGIERALVSRAFAQDAADHAILGKIQGLISQQESFIGEFGNLATEEHMELFRTNLVGDHIEQIADYRVELTRRAARLALIDQMENWLGFGGPLNDLGHRVADDPQALSAELDEAARDFGKLCDEYQELLAPTSAHQAHIDQLRGLFERRKEAVAQAIALGDGGAPAQEVARALQVDSSGEASALDSLRATAGFVFDGSRAFDMYTRKIDQIKSVDDELSRDLLQATGDAKATARNSMILYLLLFGALLVMSVRQAKTTSEGICGSAVEIVNVLESFAGGVLSKRVESKSADEIGRMGDALNASIAGVQKALSADEVDWVTVGEQRARAARLASMLENTPSNLICAGADGEVRYMNPASRDAMARIPGLASRALELPGNPLSTLHPEFGRRAADLANPDCMPFTMELELGEETLDILVSAVQDGETYLGPMVTWELVTDARVRRDATTRTTEELVACAEELRAAAAAVIDSAERTSSSSQQTVQATEAVTGSTENVAIRVSEMSSFCSDLSTEADSLKDAVDEAVRVSNGSLEMVEALRGSNEEIMRVSESIAKIADQTSLLALNASIEAASAGDAGRGFAVVAAEVKDLARETLSATASIHQQVKDIGQRSEDVAGATDMIVEVVRTVDALSQRVAAATEKQVGATHAIQESTQAASSRTLQIAREAEHLSEASEAARHTADGLLAAAEQVHGLALSLGELDRDPA